MKEQNPLDQLSEKLVRTLAKTSIEYSVIEPGDNILVAMSGGKDSYGLLHLLTRLMPRLPFDVKLVAVHVAQGQPGYNGEPLKNWLEQSGVPYEIVHQDTYSVVQRHTKPGETFCSVCSRMRRGVLYTTASRLGCNKIALGHHRDDTVATLMMNLFYSGKIQAMPAKYTTNNGELQVIRPMIEIAEHNLVELARLAEFPILPCGLCSTQEDHKRKFVGELLDNLEKDHPQIRNVMLGAIKNVRPSHLLDQTIERIKRT